MKKSIFFKRQSKRSFLDKPVPEDALERIFEKVRWSPSSSNAQPWRFIFVMDSMQRSKVMEGLARGNQWAARAPVLVVVCGRESDDHSRDDDPVKYYQFDSGLATMSLMLAATEEGLMTHPMAGYAAAPIKQALSIPDEYHVMCVIALGYLGSVELLDEHTRESDESPRVRKPLGEVITKDRFDF
jgi:nitroreductase